MTHLVFSARLMPAHYVALLSAFFGLVGTLLLFFGSYAFQHHEGSFLGGGMVRDGNAKISRQERRQGADAESRPPFSVSEFFRPVLRSLADLSIHRQA